MESKESEKVTVSEERSAVLERVYSVKATLDIIAIGLITHCIPDQVLENMIEDVKGDLLAVPRKLLKIDRPEPAAEKEPTKTAETA